MSQWGAQAPSFAVTNDSEIFDTPTADPPQNANNYLHAMCQCNVYPVPKTQYYNDVLKAVEDGTIHYSLAQMSFVLCFISALILVPWLILDKNNGFNELFDTLFISISVRNGLYYPVTPELINTMGNELNAVILQTVLCGIMGTGFAMASVIWEIDSWSLAKQSGIYFAVACVITFPIAYAANWMKHLIGGILSYVGIFLSIFVIVWLIQYFVWKNKIKKMNNRVKKNSSTK